MMPRSSPGIPPENAMRDGSRVDRSGLITDQLCPLFDVLKITWQP